MIYFIKKISLNIIFICVMVAYGSATSAGQHYEQKDDFDGSMFIAFRSTRQETAKAGFDFMVNYFDPNQNTMSLHIFGPVGVDCGNSGIEVKTNNGVIHLISASEDRLKNCHADVELEWIKQSFTVRIPMQNKDSLIGRMDTNSLKPHRYIFK